MNHTHAYRPSIGDRLRSFIRDSRLNPSELQRLSGVPESELRLFLENQGPPAVETVDRLAAALGLDLAAA